MKTIRGFRISSMILCASLAAIGVASAGNPCEEHAVKISKIDKTVSDFNRILTADQTLFTDFDPAGKAYADLRSKVHIQVQARLIPWETIIRIPGSKYSSLVSIPVTLGQLIADRTNPHPLGRHTTEAVEIYGRLKRLEARGQLGQAAREAVQRTNQGLTGEAAKLEGIARTAEYALPKGLPKLLQELESSYSACRARRDAKLRDSQKVPAWQ